MPNWCNSSYTIEGDKKEIKTLHGLMKKLEKMSEPAVENGFGTQWLGCLVNALGGNEKAIYCRGEWYDLKLRKNTITFSTETAWGPCNEVFDFIREKFKSLRYYYMSEESGTALYITNDSEGLYYPDRFIVEINTPQNDCQTEYFKNLECAFKWISKQTMKDIMSIEDIEILVEKWQRENENAYCYIKEYEIVN